MQITENIDLLQTVFDSAPNGIAVMQSLYTPEGLVEDFSILLFNERMLQWVGNTDYKGKSCREAFPIVKPADVFDRFINVAKTGTTIEFETWCDGKDHLNRCFHFQVLKHGELLLVTTEDITRRKKAEIALTEALNSAEKQQRLYDSIINNTPDLVYVFDLNYRFTYANKALLSMWGKTAEEAIGKGLRDNGYEEWHALMHEREIDNVIATGKRIRGTVSFPHAELGRRVYDYIFAPVFNEQGVVEAIAGTTRDITDFKQAEEHLQQSEAKLKSVIDQTPAATLVLRGDDLVIEQINHTMLQFIGQNAEIVGKPLITVLPELEGQYVWSQVQKVYKEGIPFNQSEVLVRHKRNGIIQDHYYNLAYRPLMEDGQITGMIQVAIDVTEQVVARKRLEESENRYRTLSETLEQQIVDRTKELQRSNEDLQQFAHVASHDLKEPVRKIKTFTDRLEKNLAGKLDEEGAKFIERIHIATNRMYNMIDGVLTYSTTNAGIQNCEFVDLNDVIKSIETDLEVKLQTTGAKITSSNLPVVEGARVLLYQLFYNLINNSIKFVAPGSAPRILISSEQITGNDTGFVRIILRDNGIGFEQEFAERIFETFTRLNSKDSYEGTGLGLSLCKKIVERHGGNILASGDPGMGASFTITLPLLQKQALI
ncbi:MAG: PAS domain-containing protein [Bacteroidetes bacterium]|nr:PAS domain-containing protein [Bacteroidota bacterium]